MRLLHRAGFLSSIGLLFSLGCSNGSGSLEPQEQQAQQPAGPFSIGGVVSGLTGSGLALQLNGGSAMSIGANGAFIFPGTLAQGASYSVSVSTQPSSPEQACTVTGGSGTVGTSNISNISVGCTNVAPNTFSIGGTVRGLVGMGLALSLNGAEQKAIASNGAFTFDTRLQSGAAYAVTIATSPSNPSQTCTIARGSGTVTGDVANIEVACATTGSFSVGGSASGLLGSGLVLQNNGGDALQVNGNGSFTFPARLADGAAFNVTVRTQPANPTQACTVSNGTGTISGANVTNVGVSCAMSEFSIGGTVSGLTGSGLVLRNNGQDRVTINANGRFTFPSTLPSGARYDIAIEEQPRDPSQTCSLTNGSGQVGTANVTNITVTCQTTGFRVGGRVSKLRGFGLILQNNGGDDLQIGANGSFTFPTPVPSGSPYNVTVLRQPFFPPQTCRVEKGSGTVEDEDVDDPRVECRNEDDDD